MVGHPWRNWFWNQPLPGVAGRSPARRPQTRFRPAVERLETRALPSVQPVSVALPGGPSITADNDSWLASANLDAPNASFGGGRKVPDVGQTLSDDGRFAIF